MTSTHPAPVSPFSAWPVQRFVTDVGFYWYAEPGALVSQTVVAHATPAVVDLHNDVVDRVLAQRGNDLTEAGGLLLFNDWRSVRSVAPGTRSCHQERMKRRVSGFARRTIVVIDPANRLLRMAVEAANVVSALLHQARIEVALSPHELVREVGLLAPSSGEPFPG